MNTSVDVKHSLYAFISLVFLVTVTSNYVLTPSPTNFII